MPTDRPSKAQVRSDSARRFRAAFGEAVKRRRQQLGLTQGELAARMGVHRQTIAKYEAGAIVASGSALPTLLEALQTNEREFFSGEIALPLPDSGTTGGNVDATMIGPGGERIALQVKSHSLPRELRAMALRFLAEANEAGADEGFLRYAKHSLEDPELATLYAGGLDEEGRPMTAEEQRDDYEAVIDGLRLIMKRRLARARANG